MVRKYFPKRHKAEIPYNNRLFARYVFFTTTLNVIETTQIVIYPNFYIGYLKQEKNVNYLSPRITSSVEAVINGSEQRINQNLFKIAVELGKLAHTIAAANEVDEDTLRELHAMCVDEVRHINGALSFESAVKFQNE